MKATQAGSSKFKLDEFPLLLVEDLKEIMKGSMKIKLKGTKIVLGTSSPNTKGTASRQHESFFDNFAGALETLGYKIFKYSKPLIQFECILLLVLILLRLAFQSFFFSWSFLIKIPYWIRLFTCLDRKICLRNSRQI